jgi:hypothetical protein
MTVRSINQLADIATNSDKKGTLPFTDLETQSRPTA